MVVGEDGTARSDVVGHCIVQWALFLLKEKTSYLLDSFYLMIGLGPRTKFEQDTTKSPYI